MKLAPEEIEQIRLGYPRGHKAIAALLAHIQAITQERDELREMLEYPMMRLGLVDVEAVEWFDKARALLEKTK